MILKCVFLSHSPELCWTMACTGGGLEKHRAQHRKGGGTVLCLFSDYTTSSLDSFRAESTGAEHIFGSSTRTSSPRRCCLEWNDCKRCLMLRYRIDNVCSVAHGTSAFKVRKVSELKAIYPLQCHFQSGWHSLQTGGSISDGGKVEEKGSNASVQSFIHFFLLFSCLPLPNEHVGDVAVLKAMAPSFS